MGAENTVIKIPEVDSAYGLDLCDGDFNIYLRSLRLYVSNIPSALDKLSGVTEQTLKDYTVNVHGIKGMSEYIGALEAKETAKQLEDISKRGDFDGIKAQNDSFIKLIKNLVNNIKIWLDEYDAQCA